MLILLGGDPLDQIYDQIARRILQTVHIVTILPGSRTAWKYIYIRTGLRSVTDIGIISASTATMHWTTFFLPSLLVSVSSAIPVANPIEHFKRAGPAAGQVITKCSSSGVLALAFDDGPYQYTQTLIDTLNAGGAKGTFFVTGTLYGN
jgi:hypothetical protein